MTEVPVSAWRRVVARLRRDRLDEELAEEIRLHLELRRQALIEAGIDPAEAASAARRQFGNVTFIREESRAMWGFGWLDTIEQDIRYGFRLLWRAPWFTAVAVLSLTAGIGSAATVFHIANAVLLRELPVRAPHELHEFTATLSLGGGAKHMRGVDPATFRRMRSAADFADLAGFTVVENVVIAASEATAPRIVRAESVTEDYFDILGIRPAVGRLLDEGDSGTAVVPAVLSERLWRTAFAGDRSIASRTITVNGVPAAIVGVAAGFRGVMTDRPADIFVPQSAASRLDARASSSVVRVLARLRPGVTSVVAEQQMKALLLGVGPSMVRGGELRVSLVDARLGVADARGPLTRPLIIGLILAGVLLIVSCANTGGLLLARFTSRQGEFALRLAIGASRARLLRQLTIEALLIALIAGAAAVVLAALAAPVLLQIVPAGSSPPEFDLRFDWRVAVFTGIAAAIAAVAAGGISLLRVQRAAPASILNANVRTVVAGPRRLTRRLVAAQIASSLLLVVGAASMTRTLMNLRNVHPGFEAEGAIAIRVDASARGGNASAFPAYFQQLFERIASAPHVGRATLAQVGLMSGAATTGTVEIAGFVPRTDDDPWVRMFWVGPDFFGTLRMRLLLGRDLERQDFGPGERVAVVNERFARFYFGGPDAALGRMINRDVRVVGIVADAHYDTLRDAPARAMFVPFTKAPPRAAMTFIVQPSGDRTRAVESALTAIRAHDPQIRAEVTTVAEQIAGTLLRERFMAIVAAVLSCLGVFLSAAGLYAAVSYTVCERRGEFAVRLALGATARDILTLVLREPLRIALTGVALGIPGAYVVMRAASSLLYGIAPFDPITVAIGGLVLIAAALAAALWPALRAGRIDPLTALRT